MILLRSYVLRAKDPHIEKILASLQPVPADEDALEREFRRIVLPYVRWEPQTEIREGDMASCRLESVLPRFQKENVKFIAGSRMFQLELEQAATGMKPGDCKTVSLPEGTVRMTVLEALRRVVPEPSEEMVSPLDIEGVSSLADYRDYLRRKQREESARDTMQEPLQKLIREVVAGSEFVLYEEDWETLVQQRLETYRVLFRQEGMDLETAEAKDFANRIPVKSYAELVADEQKDAWGKLCLLLLGRYYAKESGYSPGEKDYDEYIRGYCRTWRCPEKEAMEITPYGTYVNQSYVCYATERLKSVILERLLEEK